MRIIFETNKEVQYQHTVPNYYDKDLIPKLSEDVMRRLSVAFNGDGTVITNVYTLSDDFETDWERKRMDWHGHSPKPVEFR